MAQKLVKGLFVTFEGPEGSGKSTHSECLHKELISDGYEVIRTHEPGDTVLGDNIRRILLREESIGLCEDAELLLFEADRAQHVHEIIKPSLDGKKIVLCDRFNTATFAYQGYGLGVDIEKIKEVDDIATGGICPDLTFILDIDVILGLERAGRCGDADRMEKRDIDFHNRVRNGYLEVASCDPDKYRIIDAAKSKEEVYMSIKEELYDFIRKCSGTR